MVSAPPSPAARAEAAQREASDPAASALVLASAGSGKTKLLVDRILRLLLAGAAPERLLCLTYTRAAAAEMALRLRERLGRWVLASADELGRELAGLGVADTPEVRRRARTLFAELLDLPGGLRIDTIHAFCQAVLRRFPLEAGLSPHFDVIEEGERAELIGNALEEVLAHGVEGRREERERLAGAIALLSTRVEREDLITAIGLILDEPGRYRRVLALGAAERRRRLGELLGLGIRDEATFWQRALNPDRRLLAALQRLAGAPDATPKQREQFETLIAWLEAPEEERRASFYTDWCGTLLNSAQEPKGNLLGQNTKLSKLLPEAAECLRQAQADLSALCKAREVLGELDVALAFLDIASPVIERFEEEKRREGFLDFTDLIERTADLLHTCPAAWVLYKLDGGIDHILVDEAQDTAPAQWRIIDALSAEFFAGESARPATRTLFVVGDIKQSIYSFQGARPETLLPRRARWREQARAAGLLWRDMPLNVSFRSTAPLLALVDAVFGERAAALGLPAEERISHCSAREERGGRIELWPLLHSEGNEEDLTPPCDDPPDPKAILAREVAGWISRLLKSGARLPASGRRLEARDILVLVRRRTVFDAHLVRELKRRDVNVAGRDRLLLTEQPAVADVLNLCEVILLPEDDLALACFLVSPLGGLDQESLMALALGREESLWQTLLRRQNEREEWGRAAAYLKTLLDRHDFTSPYGLIAEALHALGGRARLLARFGEEALEPLAELLAEARRFSEIHPPSLQEFVHWLRLSGEEIKRAPENLADAVRIMTVHGAKGLQAPLVILPDTTFDPDRMSLGREPVFALSGPEGDIPFFCRRSSLPFGEAFTRAREGRRQEDRAEHHRLLYVALTRAAEWLVICGVENGGGKNGTDDEGGAPPSSWYRLIREGMQRLEGVREEDRPAPEDRRFTWAGRGMRLEVEDPHAFPAASLPPPPPPSPPLPPFVQAPHHHPAPPPAGAPRRLTPASPYIPSPRSPLRDLSPARLSALGRGEAIHDLLARGPYDENAAEEVRRFLCRHGMSRAEAEEVRERLRILFTAPECAPFFDPAARAEVPVAGRVRGFEVMGTIDRLLITEEAVWVADFKTDAAPPPPGRIPPRYLRQLALYGALLRDLHPNRPVRAALIWTALPRLEWVPEEVLLAHLPSPEA